VGDVLCKAARCNLNLTWAREVVEGGAIVVLTVKPAHLVLVLIPEHLWRRIFHAAGVARELERDPVVKTQFVVCNVEVGEREALRQLLQLESVSLSRKRRAKLLFQHLLAVQSHAGVALLCGELVSNGRRHLLLLIAWIVWLIQKIGLLTTSIFLISVIVFLANVTMIGDTSLIDATIVIIHKYGVLLNAWQVAVELCEL